MADPERPTSALTSIREKLRMLGEAAQKWPPTEPNLAEQIWDECGKLDQVAADLARVTAERDEARSHIEALRDMPPTFAASMMLRMEANLKVERAALAAMTTAREETSPADAIPRELTRELLDALESEATLAEREAAFDKLRDLVFPPV